MKKLDKKGLKKLHTWIRAVIQLLYFLFLPSAYTAAFAGVKYIFTQIGNGAEVELTSFVAVLIVLCVYTVVFGRFFCGFACAFGSLGDAVHALYVWICKKLKKKPVRLNQKLTGVLSCMKYVVLAAIVLLCFAGAFGKTQGTSPWEVFSMLHARNFKLSGYGIGILLLVLIIIGMCLQERFFCRFLCPMGAVFSLLPVLPAFSLHRDRKQCLNGCSACTRMCPSGIELPSKGSWEVSGDCFQCQKCTDTCPKGNVKTAIGIRRGNEVLFTIIRAVLLLLLFLWLGI